MQNKNKIQDAFMILRSSVRKHFKISTLHTKSKFKYRLEARLFHLGCADTVSLLKEDFLDKELEDRDIINANQ